MTPELFFAYCKPWIEYFGNWLHHVLGIAIVLAVVNAVAYGALYLTLTESWDQTENIRKAIRGLPANGYTWDEPVLEEPFTKAFIQSHKSVKGAYSMPRTVVGDTSPVTVDLPELVNLGVVEVNANRRVRELLSAGFFPFSLILTSAILLCHLLFSLWHKRLHVDQQAPH